MPPPSVRPAMPVWVTMPPTVARPCACVAASSSPHRTPPPARAVRARGSTAIARIGDRSITSPSSLTARPATPWPPPRTATAGRARAPSAQRGGDVAARRRSARSAPAGGRSRRSRPCGPRRRRGRRARGARREAAAGRRSSRHAATVPRAAGAGKSRKWTSHARAVGDSTRGGPHVRPVLPDRPRDARSSRRAGRRSSCATCCSAARRSARSRTARRASRARCSASGSSCSSATGSSSALPSATAAGATC